MDTNATAGENIVVTREFDAPPERVWKYWIEPERLRLWFAQQQFDVPVCTIDLRVGGRMFICMRGLTGDFKEWRTYCGWTFKEIVRDRRLAMTGYFADQDGNEVPASAYGADVWPDEVEYSMELEAHNGGTRITLTETVLPLAAQEQWWGERLDKLAQLLHEVGSPHANNY